MVRYGIKRDGLWFTGNGWDEKPFEAKWFDCISDAQSQADELNATVEAVG